MICHIMVFFRNFQSNILKQVSIYLRNEYEKLNQNHISLNNN